MNSHAGSHFGCDHPASEWQNIRAQPLIVQLTSSPADALCLLCEQHGGPLMIAVESAPMGRRANVCRECVVALLAELESAGS